jgi:hypothetical protein
MPIGLPNLIIKPKSRSTGQLVFHVAEKFTATEKLKIN